VSQLSLSPISQDYLVENLFSLAIMQKTNSTKIVLQALSNQIDTAHLPSIVDQLQRHLPSVLLTTCFNDENLPFLVEVKKTEIGHLFEHILLDYLCQLKIAKGYNSAVFSGRTRWNWIKEPRGKFHIRLNCGTKDADIFPLAIEKTIALMKTLLLLQLQKS